MRVWHASEDHRRQAELAITGIADNQFASNQSANNRILSVDHSYQTGVAT